MAVNATGGIVIFKLRLQPGAPERTFSMGTHSQAIRVAQQLFNADLGDAPAHQVADCRLMLVEDAY